MSRTARRPSGTFRLSCLGPGQLLAPDGRRLPLRTRKHLALLLLLGLKPGRPVSRDRLIELLWSEDGERAARHSLSQSVSLINKAADEDLIAVHGANQLVIEEGALGTDVAEFEALARDGRHDEARALWHGTLLDGMWLRRAPAFERWLGDERGRLERLMRRMSAELVERRRQDGDHTGMRAEAEALLALDPLDEGAMLACLQALTLAGERTLALRRYAEFERRLKAELDAEPGVALRSWARRYRKSEPEVQRPPVASRVHEVQSLPAAQPLFGRVEEYRQLWEAWERATTGTGSFWIIEGEPGIGKTALVGKLANQVHVSGASVCFVKCYATEKAVPFAPISALIRQLARLPGFVGTSPSWIGEMTRLVPELKDRFPNAPPPMGVDDSARFRLCDATVQAAESVADEQPLLIVVDDIHDADEATLALVHYLGRQIRAKCAVAIVTARSTGERTPFQQTFFSTALGAGMAFGRVLPRLADDAIAKLATQLFAARGNSPSQPTLSTIIDLANGNPLSAIEACLSTSASVGAHQRLSENRTDTSTSRFQELPASARTVASALALAGRPLSNRDLSDVTGLGDDVVSRSVTDLRSAHFVRRLDELVTFVHDQYQLAVLHCTPDILRARIHASLARMMATGCRKHTTAPMTIAQHLASSGRNEEASQHALAAARYAKSLGAVRERAMALELAAELSGRNVRTLVDLADCYLHLKEFQRVRAVVDEVGAKVERDSDVAMEAAYLRATAAYQSGESTLGDTKAALSRIALRGETQSYELPALFQLLRLSAHSSDRSYAREVARRIRARASIIDSAAARGYRLLAAGYVITKYYCAHRALPALDAALLAAREASDWELEAASRDTLGAALKQAGRFAESLEQISHGLAFARSTMNPQAEAAYLSNLAVTELALGLLDEADEHLRDSEAIDSWFPRWPMRAYRMSNQGVALFHRRDYFGAAEALNRACSFAAEQGLSSVRLACLGMLGMCAVRLEDRAMLSQTSALIKECIGVCRSGVSDLGPTEAALAWSKLFDRNGQEALTQLSEACRRLKRRDADHWMFAELERIRISEAVSGEQATTDRQSLFRYAERSGALLFARDAIADQPT